MRQRELPILLQYLIRRYREFMEEGLDPSEWRLPPLHDISAQLGNSVPNLREQLAVARAMGFVSAKPKVGIYLKPYSFYPPISLSLRVAVSLDRWYFDQYLDLRRRLERMYFLEAAQRLTEEDKQYLKSLVDAAWQKLQEDPIRIPHREHREFHMTIYRRLENPFVQGLLAAFWDAYETVGLNRYQDLDYLRTLWTHHQAIADAIMEGDYEKAYEVLDKHLGMLETRKEQPKPVSIPASWEEEF